ncbi:Tripartite tricarboxylate transporter TctB family protein [Lentibacillus halodurans]|uniref:Tripartite tricarboxylate transporter TctB family protein n=1 Tax=Lentibacillus halodurans TaxID=237679 RepID=A0A1I1AN58_9BACI|nr:tripartite tricarboxylate transporter TctB family protein [Lentibacillus halodurans]SFB37763.1 Tripartite tricarboxylate transporter TctB family protein [Lentibacillus halodurans]
MKYLGNIIFVIFLVGFGIVYYLEVLAQARDFEHHAMISIIFAVLVLLAMLSVISDVRSWLKESEKINISWSNFKKPLVFLILMSGYLAAVNILGFFTASFIFFIITAFWLGARNWKELILVPAVILTLTYWLFVVFLNQRVISGIFI